jgi:hypothetical protein
MGATYTYLIADLMSGTILDELPLSGVAFDKRLNDVGSLRGQLQVTDPEIRDRLPRRLTEPGRTAVYVDRDGDLLWGGIIWTSRYTASSGVLEIGAADFLSYFEHRRVVTLPLDQAEERPYVPPDPDQLAIAADLIARAQSHPGGDLDIDVRGAGTTSVPRNITYALGEQKPVADALRDLANADGGFDFVVDVAYDSALRPRRFLQLGYPRLGQSGAPHVWEYGANLIDFVWPRDAASMATRLFAQGTSETEQPLVRYAEDTTAYAQGWPLLEDAASQLDTKDSALVLAQAQGELAVRRRPVVLPELTVRADLAPVVGDYAVGDDARLVIDDPIFTDTPLDVLVRIMSFEVTPGDDAGLEQVTLTVAPLLEPGI